MITCDLSQPVKTSEKSALNGHMKQSNKKSRNATSGVYSSAKLEFTFMSVLTQVIYVVKTLKEFNMELTAILTCDFDELQ